MSIPREYTPGVSTSGPLTYQPSPKWVRGEARTRTVVDSKRPTLLWEQGHVLPVYLFPLEDVDAEILTESPRAPDDESHRAVAGYFDLEIDGEVTRHAAWSYRADDLEDLVAFDWAAMDRWLEEDEELFAHPRDPYHRVDSRHSSRRVSVSVDGTELADSGRPMLVFETELPTRFYLPRDDVRMELLEPSDTRTFCAYKGEASYYSVRVGDEVREDLAWTYESPLPDNARLAGLIAFFNEHVDLIVDGIRLERPETQWSAGLRENAGGGGSGRGQG